MGSVNAGYYLYTWVVYIINILYLSFKYLIFVYHSNATTVTTIIAGITSDVLVVLSLFEKKNYTYCRTRRLSVSPSVCMSVCRSWKYAQYLVGCLEEEHTCHNITNVDPPPREMIETLVTNHHHTVELFRDETSKKK